MLDFFCDLLPTVSTATHLCAPQKRRGFLDTHWQVPSPHSIPCLLLSAQLCIPALPLPAFSRFMVEAACTAAAAAGSRGDAGSSSVAGVEARCRVSSRRLHVVSRRACVREEKQVRELRHSDRPHCAGHGASSRHFSGLARRSEQGRKCRRQNSGAWGNPSTKSVLCWEAATMNLCFQFSP